MNYATIKPTDVANGPGVRVSLFVSGCTHYCEGCFNAEAWDFCYGKEYTEETEKQILTYLDHNYIAGLSLLGGEPMHPKNQGAILTLLKRVKEQFPDKTIWCYTGYDYETEILGTMWNEIPETREILPYIDVLVDGKFVADKKDLNLRFKGSTNQKIIKVPQSLKAGKTILWE